MSQFICVTTNRKDIAITCPKKLYTTSTCEGVGLRKRCRQFAVFFLYNEDVYSNVVAMSCSIQTKMCSRHIQLESLQVVYIYINIHRCSLRNFYRKKTCTRLSPTWKLKHVHVLRCL